MNVPLVRLQPSLRSQVCATAAGSYVHSFNAVIAQQWLSTQWQSGYRRFSGDAGPEDSRQDGPRIRTWTLESTKALNPNLWPRMPRQKDAVDVKKFRDRYGKIPRTHTVKDEVIIRGIVWSYRIAGSKLAFIDIFQDGATVQCMCNFSNLENSGLQPSEFKTFLNGLHRGDVISVRGHPHRTLRNEISVLATELPLHLSRCLQALPEQLANEETKIRNRHVDLLIRRRAPEILRLRSGILDFLRSFFTEEGFVDVQTPILADGAGGAVARPFHTHAMEFGDRQLALRIAPELWLKRLILGGFEKVYEIGPSFRNEGIDLNHNPEFWTCEFYKTYADLDELIGMTERMFRQLSTLTARLIYSDLRSLDAAEADFTPPYHRLDFIPTLEAEMGTPLPDLASPDAGPKLTQLLQDSHISLPVNPTLPRLLDKLSSEYLEPQCSAPTWIINHPECLSPLSKSFKHTANNQRVAARAELFVNKQELVNTYEEENSPIEQRRKFEMQVCYKHSGDPASSVDESYLQALEWGMPPTGGWGCGIDRLCMLFAGTNRIADTLSFGTLRNVVALGRTQKQLLDESEGQMSTAQIAGTA
ncbi:MAG: hypothetical protein Q9217_003048 [Psora testacea]